jgi:hypothetical protein
VTPPASLLRARLFALFGALIVALGLGGLSAVALGAPASRSSPVITTTAPTSTPAAGAEESQVANGSADVLSANGFQSYDCLSGGSGLSSVQQQDCRSSGAPWQPEPLGNYLFDIHINTGITAFGADIASAFENLILTPIWLAILYALHAILVAVSWALELNILSGAMPAIAHALAVGQQIFTTPWMAAALALAAVGLLWHGLGRRGVSQSLGDAVAMALMIIVALGLIADPQGTIGQVNTVVNQASLGTATAAAAGNPSAGAASFDQALSRVFSQTIADPFGVLEFGDLNWAHGLDPKAAAARQQLLASPPADLTGHDTAALRAASDNSQIFLAFNSNGPTRNGMNSGKLMQAICGTSTGDADSCHGTASTPASVPQFRSSNSIWQRTAALLLIVVGAIGEILVFAFVTYKLLLAALMALVLLLLAPLMALAPAFGESGRGTFKKWGLRLLGAVLAKLMYAFFLGVLLLAAGVLGQFSANLFFVQFALLGAFWWVVFLHRHQLTELTSLSHADMGSRALSGLLALRLAQTTMRRARPGRASAGTHRPAPVTSARAALEGRRHEQLHAAHEVARSEREAIVTGSLEHDLRGHERAASQRNQTAQERRRLQAQERRLIERLGTATEGPDQIRVADRLERVRGELAANEQRHRVQVRSQAVLERANANRAQTGTPFTAGELREREELLRTNANLPAGQGTGQEVGSGRARDYERLAGLAARTGGEYRQAAPLERARIRRQVDERLAAFARHDRLASQDGPQADPRVTHRYIQEAEAARTPAVILGPRTPPANTDDAPATELAQVAERIRTRTGERVRERSARERQFGRQRSQ